MWSPLIPYGAQDVYLTGNHKIDFFKISQKNKIQMVFDFLIKPALMVLLDLSCHQLLQFCR